MPQVFYILFGAVFTLMSCYALGRLMFQRLQVRLFRSEEVLLSLVCGASVLHLIVFLITAAGQARKAVFLVVGVLIIAAATHLKAWRLPSNDPAPLTRFWKWLFGLVLAAYAFLYLANSMAPEMSPDGATYHLGLVSRYLREHGFPRITTNMYANLSQGAEMLYMFAFSFGRHSAAATVHCGFTLTLPLLMLAYARRFGFGAAGVAGAVMVLCAPVVGVAGTTGYNDLVVSCSVFATFYLLSIWAEERQRGLLVLIGLLAGFCFAGKYTAGLAIPLALGWVMLREWRSGRWLRSAVTVGLAASLMVVPWLAKNWIIVRNPLSPFANRLFPNPYIRISFEEDYIRMMRHYGEVTDYSIVPIDLTVKGERLAGLLGPVFLLVPIGLLALRRREGRQLLLAGAIFALPYFNNIGTRFLLPAIPFLALAVGLACERARFVLPLIVVFHAVLSWPHVLKGYCSPYAWRLNRVPVAAALRLTPEEKYLTERFDGYLVARMIEDNVPKGERVFVSSGVPEAYTSREILVNYQAAFNNGVFEMLWMAADANSAPTRRLRFQFPERPVRFLRVYQNAPPSQDMWSIDEIRVLDGDREIKRDGWRVQAWPNAWESQLAVDNNPVTRWQAAQSAERGMFFEIDLGAEHNEIDAVIIETTKDHYQVDLQLYGKGSTGEWQQLAVKPEDTELPLMRGLRRAAADKMLALGLRWVVIAAGDYLADDFRLNGKLWGAELVAERNGVRLYRLEAGE